MNAYESALNLLARREHASEELRQKLRKKAFAEDEIAAVLLQLQQAGWQSDSRFAEAYVRYRRAAGFGPRRIAQELAQRGINRELMAEKLQPRAACWQIKLEEVWQKKFANIFPQDAQDYARQARFLLQRGFDPVAIAQLLAGHLQGTKRVLNKT